MEEEAVLELRVGEEPGLDSLGRTQGEVGDAFGMSSRDVVAKLERCGERADSRGVRGLEPLEHLLGPLAERPDLPIVFMSGYAETGSEQAELRHGRPWLDKPFDPNELESAVAKALAGTRAAA